MSDLLVVAKCANRSEADQIAELLRSAGIEPEVQTEEGSSGLKVAVTADDLESALDLLAEQAPTDQKPVRAVGRKALEWTGRCPACGSMNIAPIEHGALSTAAVVVAALGAAAYGGARRMHLHHPALDALAVVPLMLVVSWIVLRKTPNARCDSCHTYWKARR